MKRKKKRKIQITRNPDGSLTVRSQGTKPRSGPVNYSGAGRHKDHKDNKPRRQKDRKEEKDLE
jgi:hypothetical protein